MNLGLPLRNSTPTVLRTQDGDIHGDFDPIVTTEALHLFCNFWTSMASNSLVPDAGRAPVPAAATDCRRSDRLRGRDIAAGSLRPAPSSAPSQIHAPPFVELASKKVRPRH